MLLTNGVDIFIIIPTNPPISDPKQSIQMQRLLIVTQYRLLDQPIDHDGKFITMTPGPLPLFAMLPPSPPPHLFPLMILQRLSPLILPKRLSIFPPTSRPV